MQPVRNGFINSMQVYPFTQGALYQVYTAVGQITDIALQPGEQLVGSGPVSNDKPVRVTVELPAALHRDLVAYAAALAEAKGQSAIKPKKLIVPMLLLSRTPLRPRLGDPSGPGPQDLARRPRRLAPASCRPGCGAPIAGK